MTNMKDPFCVIENPTQEELIELQVQEYEEYMNSQETKIVKRCKQCNRALVECESYVCERCEQTFWDVMEDVLGGGESEW